MYPSSALGEFLKSRRARLRPEELGLPGGLRRRRVAGLRREELAPLAGVSVGYYTRLEQGQAPNVSDEVLDSLARTLRLDPVERRHIHRLARLPRTREPARPEAARPDLTHMVGALTDVPAIAVGRCGDILAWNPLAHALLAPHWPFAPVGQLPNFVRIDFLEQDFAQSLYGDWAAKAQDDIAYLQVSVSNFPDDQRLRALIAELKERSPQFRAMWSEHPVSNCATIEREYRHPQVGAMTLTAALLRPPDDEGQGVTTFQAEPGSVSQERLRRLAGLTSGTAV
ncbi:helix-turn-helix domain-containing protein [Streptomyces sp. SID5785]|uniref:helix-turn-helix transcriptional regulator n=1 Tax=Streptomyces sp. SID5785 TaxID=2690309 RepID=UPI001361E48E|nr:helix-turn-helix transcriptional regulator [Streptomyces sp. SID5785]MZD10555.1 helix-turn-helix domain-containing protein [Streptomyces sp. SID5785]